MSKILEKKDIIGIYKNLLAYKESIQLKLVHELILMPTGIANSFDVIHPKDSKTFNNIDDAINYYNSISHEKV